MSKRSLPWITQHIKRLIGERDSLFQKRKKGHHRDKRHFKEVKHLVQSKIKTAYNNYLRSVLGLSDEKGNIDTDSGKQKLSLIKYFPVYSYKENCVKKKSSMDYPTY